MYLILTGAQKNISCSSAACSVGTLWFSSNWQEKFELWRKFILSIKSVGEIDSSNSAVSVDLNSKSLYVVGTVGSSSEIRQVKLNLIPALIESHWHGANKRFYPSSWLIVGGSESTSNRFVIKYLNLESEILFEILNDHDQERKLDSKSLFWIKRSIDVVGGDVGSHDLKHGWLNIWIGYSLDVTVSDLFIPNLERFGTNRVQNGKETALIGGLKHFK